jgi:hypothetical protein
MFYHTRDMDRCTGRFYLSAHNIAKFEHCNKIDIDHIYPIFNSHEPLRIEHFTMSTSELATSYAALILADDGVDITVRDPRSSPHSMEIPDSHHAY